MKGSGTKVKKKHGVADFKFLNGGGGGGGGGGGVG